MVSDGVLYRSDVRPHLQALADAVAEGDPTSVRLALVDVCDEGGALDVLQADRLLQGRSPAATGREPVRVAVVGTYTTDYFVRMLHVVLVRCGVAAVVQSFGYDQVWSQLLEPATALYRWDPDVVVVAVDDRALRLADLADDPRREVAAEVERWRTLWETVRSNCRARVVQMLPALPQERGLGNLSLRLPNSWYRMAHEVNLALADAAGPDVLTVDCERISGVLGKERWFDGLSSHRLSQPMSFDALTVMARETAAVISGDLGLAKKCVVVDLDNTLWGGLVGEQGPDGVRLAGEGFLDLQRFLLGLKKRGTLLAVCSLNNAEDARAPFLHRAEMCLRLPDFSCFSASWRPKPVQLMTIATRLGIGLDRCVLVDDDPAQRALVRRALPEVEVITPPTPAAAVRALLRFPLLEQSWIGAEDRRRAQSYEGLRQAEQLRAVAGAFDDYCSQLRMSADIGPLEAATLPRIAQLVGRTNQFNLTNQRRGQAELARMLDDPSVVTLVASLRDCFIDHGVVSFLLAVTDQDRLVIDTWVMSCRVLGRTLERSIMHRLLGEAATRGLTVVEGRYVPSARNSLVAEVYGDLGFSAVDDPGTGSVWHYELDRGIPPASPFISIGRLDAPSE